MHKALLFIGIFLSGEVIFNLTWFRYLKSYFKFTEADNGERSFSKILFLELSTFKGVMERFLLTIGLVCGFAPVLIVFGTIKLGTRFKENQEVKNDYFLIGNFSSILVSMLYYYLFSEMPKWVAI